MFEELKQHKLALVFIAVLVVAKFVVVPIYDWQDQTISDISLLENKLIRANALLGASDESELFGNAIDSAVNEARLSFRQINPQDNLQLIQQQWLETTLAKHDLRISNVGWSSLQALENVDLIAITARLSINGKSVNIFRFIQEVQGLDTHTSIDSFNITLRGQGKENLGNAQARVNLTFYGVGVQG